MAFELEKPFWDWFVLNLPPSMTATQLGEDGSEAQVLIAGAVTEQDLQDHPNLKVVVVPFAGILPVTRLSLLGNKQISVYNLHFNASATAEKSIELMCAVAKGTIRNDSVMRGGTWKPEFRTSHAIELAGKNALIVGFGAIGHRIARVCQALEMNIQALRRRPGSEDIHGINVSNISRLEECLAWADVIHIAIPATSETNGMFNFDRIKLLKSHSILVNIGRGSIIDQGALFSALNERRIFGAGLDVWWNYPGQGECEPSEFPFHTLDNVVMSPHCGGTTVDTEQRRMESVVKLLHMIHDNDPELEPVDLENGY